MSRMRELEEHIKNTEESIKEMEENIENIELTAEEKATWDEIKSTKNSTVNEVTPNGIGTSTPLETYIEGIDKAIDTNEKAKVRLITSKLENDVTKIKGVMDDELLEAIKKYSSVEDITIEEATRVINLAVEAFRVYFKMDTTSITIANRIGPLTVNKILDILPEEFTNTFIDKKLVTFKSMKIKEIVVTLISLVLSADVEFDRLSEEIESTNRTIDVLLRLQDANIDALNIIKDEKSMNELVEDILQNTNVLNDTYRKYVKTPDYINNQYIQKAHLLEKYADAYESILPEYDPETQGTEIEVIKKEIESNRTTAKCYRNILELNNFKSVVENLSIQYKSNKKINRKFLDNKALENIGKFKKLEESVSIPGYRGTEKTEEQICNSFVRYMTSLIPAYNNVIDIAMKNGDDSIKPIEDEPELVAKVLILVLGSITKKLTKVNKTKYDSYELTVTFDMVCSLGTEIFMLDKIYNTIKPLIQIFK